MRSSNYKHCKTNNRKQTETKDKVKKFSKIGSLIATAFIVITAVVIPSISLVQNVAAVSDEQKPTISVGDTDILGNAVTAPTEKKEVKKTKKVKKAEKETQPATEAETEAPTEPETEAVTDAPTEPETEAYTEPETETEAVNASISGTHITLSDYDRTLLEGLVMGEAGGYGYECCALVAQAVHDSMIESGTTSVDAIISSYGYDASPANIPTSTVKSAVSFIFDSDGRAVDHRILYFYSADMVSSDWHESQTFVTSCGNVRFFDKV